MGSDNDQDKYRGSSNYSRDNFVAQEQALLSNATYLDDSNKKAREQAIKNRIRQSLLESRERRQI